MLGLITKGAMKAKDLFRSIAKSRNLAKMAKMRKAARSAQFQQKLALAKAGATKVGTSAAQVGVIATGAKTLITTAAKVTDVAFGLGPIGFAYAMMERANNMKGTAGDMKQLFGAYVAEKQASGSSESGEPTAEENSTMATINDVAHKTDKAADEMEAAAADILENPDEYGDKLKELVDEQGSAALTKAREWSADSIDDAREAAEIELADLHGADWESYAAEKKEKLIQRGIKELLVPRVMLAEQIEGIANGDTLAKIVNPILRRPKLQLAPSSEEESGEAGQEETQEEET